MVQHVHEPHFMNRFPRASWARWIREAGFDLVESDTFLAVELGAQVLDEALRRARLTPGDVDCLITVTCTGYMIPSLDAYLINRFRMRRDVYRLPVLQMGCAGGTSGLIYATDFLRSHPGATAAVVAVEAAFCTSSLMVLPLLKCRRRIE